MDEDNKMKSLPRGWNWLRLREIAEINPKIPNKEAIPDNREVQFLPMKLVEEVSGIIHLTEVRKYAEVKKGYTSFVDGDIIFAKVTPCMENGKIAIVDNLINGIGFGSSEFHVIRNRKELNNKYLFHYLVQNKFRNEAANAMTGAVGLRRVPKQFLEDYVVPLPPKETQQAVVSKIEELFSELDKGIENLRIAQKKLKTYRQSVLKWAFEGRLTNEIVSDGILPNGWTKAELGNICTNVEYGSSAKSKEHGKIPVLRMGNIQNGKFDWTDLVYTSDDEEIKKYLLKKNDVLFNRTNSAELVGKTAIYKGERPAIFAGYLIRIDRIESLIDADFLTYFLNSLEAKKMGNAVRSFGVNQSNINGTKLKSYLIPLPLLKEQQAIVQVIESRLSVADKLDETITQSLQQAEALRQSILKKAFEGKLV